MRHALACSKQNGSPEITSSIGSMLVNACKIDCQVVQGVSAKACHGRGSFKIEHNRSEGRKKKPKTATCIARKDIRQGRTSRKKQKRRSEGCRKRGSPKPASHGSLTTLCDMLPCATDIDVGPISHMYILV